MTKILSIEEMKKLSTPVIEIPGFDDGEKIKVRVKKPALLNMFSNGKIPNHLMGIATTMISGDKDHAKSKTDKQRNQDSLDIIELYCFACLVEPAYEEFKEIMTDDQKQAILSWGLGGLAKAETFHNEEKV